MCKAIDFGQQVIIIKMFYHYSGSVVVLLQHCVRVFACSATNYIEKYTWCNSTCLFLLERYTII